MPDRIVVVEDDRELRSLITDILEDAGYEVGPFATADRALEHIQSNSSVDAIITDLILPGMRGQQLLREVRRIRPELNVVVVTAFGSIESAIELVKAGAFDYLTKPFTADELLLVIERALSDSKLRREIAALQRANQLGGIPGFVGASRAAQEVADITNKAARSKGAVLISGESGTGKEIIARALHDLSHRKDFVAINCAALPDHLMESELFGYEKGAFTGADRAKPGLIEAAHQGTLFLDEIGELPAALQPKLLRVLESGEVRRLGSTITRQVDVRIVSASNRDLESMTRDGEFREDLYWRINVIHIDVPPLRERPVDIALLAEHFLAQTQARGGSVTTIAADAMAVLTAYPWPGNARELRNAIERAVALASGSELRVSDLPERVRHAGATAALIRESGNQDLTLRELERAYIMHVLQKTGGNKSRSAEMLGMDRKTLYRKLDEYSRD